MLTQVKDAVRRTRQHHAIEHATLHLLALRCPGQRMAGYSDPGGFTIFGNLAQENIRRAVSDAMLRLQAGESGLAIHPNCGTNLAATGLLVTTAALLGSGGPRRTLYGRFAGALVLVIPALIAGQPLGLRLQQYTTLASVGDRWVKDIRPIQMAGATAHRVEFE
jgi:hypothetical protein